MLFVLNSLSIGGTEKKIVNVANELIQNDDDVGLAYLNPPETLLDRVNPKINVTNLRRRGKYSVGALQRLRHVVNREKRLVFAVNQYPLLYVVPATKWRRIKGPRVVGLINTSESSGKARLQERIYVQFLNKCDLVVFGSENQRRLWLDKYRQLAGRSTVIYNGVDCDFYCPGSASDEGMSLRRQLRIPDNALIVGSIGRLRREKSFDHLIMALGNLNRQGREAYGLIVGEGEEQGTLERRAEQEGIASKMRFLKLQRDVRAALSIIDIFVLPSTAVETFSNAALEAMAMARTVVLSEIGGATEMVEHGSSGLIFQAGNVDSLSKVLVQLYESQDMRQQLGAAARERVERLFAFSNMVESYQSLAVD